MEEETISGWSRLKWPLTLALAAAILGGSLWLGNSDSSRSTPTPVPLIIQEQAPAPEPDPTPTGPAATPIPDEVLVYVSGAVTTPGVYQLQAGARADDAVRAAGGLSAEADAAQINLAARLRDEQHIYIPKVGEIAPPLASGGGGSPARSDGKINLNTATQAELESLPRIGPASAKRILEYRETQGPFKTIEDLRQVKGIGPATFDGLKELITVGP